MELTGNRALTGFTAPKLLWLREHEPESYARIARIMLPKDYVRLKLCGEHAIDVADASGTLLFDVARRRWSDEVLEALEIPREWLPRALESAEVSGTTPDGVPVAAGAGDQAAGALGVGAIAPGPGLGRARDLGRRVQRARRLPRRPAGARARVLPRRAGPLARDGRDALRRRLAAVVPRHARPRASSSARCSAEAERWEPGAEGLTFLPYLAGERTPHADPDARGAFAGLSLRHDRGALARAVLEGVAFGLRDCLDVVRSVGAAPEVGRASGGGARSELWLRIVASVLELPVERLAVEEGAAYGAALLGGIAGGLWADAEEAVAACVRPHGRVDPEPGWVERLRRAAGALPGALPGVTRYSLKQLHFSKLWRRNCRNRPCGGRYGDIVQAIGNTPLVELKRLSPKPGVRIWAKLESHNPTGSVKDRVARALIEDAEEKGAIRPGQTILEPTSGNTGISLAMICSRKGYKLKVVMPDNVTPERTQLLQMYGAEIVYSPGDQGSNGAVAMALEMAEADASYYMPYQYGNEANPRAHYEGTAPEILEELDEISAFVAGLGTGGTLMGNGRRLREELGDAIKIVAAEPMQGEPVQGLRSLDDGFIPPIIDLSLLDRKIFVTNHDAIVWTRKLLDEEGIFAGVSSGAIASIAVRIANEMDEGNIVFIVCDDGWKYLSSGIYTRPVEEIENLDSTVWW